MEKLKMHTPDLTQDHINRIREIFPNCVTEARDENGKLKLAVDFDQLKQELSDSIVEGAQERYHLNWPGKREALLTANAPIAKTLRPAREESVDFDTTKNLFIEGDNLEALKLLQETYLGKVKMIYIDPPYNTGNDFVYEDDFAANREEFFLKSNQKDNKGNQLIANKESNGRFHSDWLSMMYPRLKLAKRFLDDDGLIFISISQEEVSNLRKIMDEVFGAENYRNTLIVRRGAKSVQAQFETWDKLGTAFEYILMYSKAATYRFPKMMRELDDSKNGSWNNHWRGTDRPSMRYELFGITPEIGQWRWSKERSLQAIKNYNEMLTEVKKDAPSVTQEDIDNWYLEKDDEPDLLRLSGNNKPEHYIPPTDETLLNDVWFHISTNGSRVVRNLFGKKVFDNPKPLELIQQALKFYSNDALVFDFFAGSGSTAHAILEMNAEDNGKRRFITVQLPEECSEKSPAYKAGYKNIAELSKDRIRLASKNIKETYKNNIDTGFRVLKIDTSNMAEVYYTPDGVKQNDLLAAVDNIRPDRSPEDLLFQVLLDWGVVFRDNGFASDSVKINAEQIFKQIYPSMDIKDYMKSI